MLEHCNMNMNYMMGYRPRSREKRPIVAPIDLDAGHDVQNFFVEVNIGRMRGVQTLRRQHGPRRNWEAYYYVVMWIEPDYCVKRLYSHDGWNLQKVRLPLVINNGVADPPCLKIELVQRFVEGVEAGTSTGEVVVGRVRVKLVQEGKLLNRGVKEYVNLVKMVQGSCVNEGQILLAINIIEDRKHKRTSWKMLMNC
ncbi:hypothetical protein Sjap_014041 [Stephania japonica]|uniref:Uncharacterized protein n=1 Tax=Stephania japonica TaxID=461633 RepID=A0AAP0IZ62_9MAGN